MYALVLAFLEGLVAGAAVARSLVDLLAASRADLGSGGVAGALGLLLAAHGALGMAGALVLVTAACGADLNLLELVGQRALEEFEAVATHGDAVSLRTRCRERLGEGVAVALFMAVDDDAVLVLDFDIQVSVAPHLGDIEDKLAGEGLAGIKPLLARHLRQVKDSTVDPLQDTQSAIENDGSIAIFKLVSSRELGGEDRLIVALEAVHATIGRGCHTGSTSVGATTEGDFLALARDAGEAVEIVEIGALRLAGLLAVASGIDIISIETAIGVPHVGIAIAHIGTAGHLADTGEGEMDGIAVFIDEGVLLVFEDSGIALVEGLDLVVLSVEAADLRSCLVDIAQLALLVGHGECTVGEELLTGEGVVLRAVREELARLCQAACHALTIAIIDGHEGLAFVVVGDVVIGGWSHHSAIGMYEAYLAIALHLVQIGIDEGYLIVVCGTQLPHCCLGCRGEHR